MNLLKALSEEQSVFQQFSQFFKQKDCTYFWSSETNSISHWNLVYPKLESSKVNLEKAKKFYFKKALTPHIIRFNKPLMNENIAEEVEYFYLKKKFFLKNKNLENGVSHLENELEGFCDVIQKTFSLDLKTRDFFQKKMNLLCQKPDSKFYIIKQKEIVIGGASTFRTKNKNDFMFNVATLPEFQGYGIAKTIIKYVSQVSEKSILTYSHNPIMREKILPNLGYKSLGTIWIERIK